MRLPEREGRPAAAQLAAIRTQMAAAAGSGAWSSGWPREEQDIAGVRCLQFVPAGMPRGIVVHAHGGGFRMGCPEAVEPYAASLARACGVQVVCPAYRLAPEYPFPAALNDCVAVVQSVIGHADVPVVVAGDSAGGGLAAGVVLQVLRESLPVAGVVLHSPWLDLTLQAESLHANGVSDPLFSLDAAREAADLYLQGHRSKDPLASPLFGDLRSFPPTLISVGSGEVLRDDARALYDRLAAHGVEVRLVEEEGMEHTAVVRDRTLQGAPEVFAATQAFLERLLPV